VILAGELSIWVAALLAAWASVVSLLGERQHRDELIRSGHHALIATTGLLIVAAAGLWTAVFAGDLTLRHVASFTSANLPATYKIASLWAGVPGTLLTLSVLVSGAASIAVWILRTDAPDFAPIAAAALGALVFVTLCAMALLMNPYTRLAWSLPDGRGMPPGLQHPLAALRAPFVLAGISATAVSITLAAVAGVSGKWRAMSGTVRQWMLIGWALMTIGLALSLWRAYADSTNAGRWLTNPSGSIAWWVVVTAGLHLPSGRRTQRSRRLGAHLAHGGAVLATIAVIGAMRSTTTRATVPAGGTATAVDPFGRRWTFTNQGVSRFDILNREVTAVAVEAAPEGNQPEVLTSEVRQYVDGRGVATFDPEITPGTRSTPTEDVQVTVMRIHDSEAVDVRIVFSPLVVWLWPASAAMTFGGLLALWPRRS
jgi:cytochrome c biogenesis factor